MTIAIFAQQPLPCQEILCLDSFEELHTKTQEQLIQLKMKLLRNLLGEPRLSNKVLDSLYEKLAALGIRVVLGPLKTRQDESVVLTAVRWTMTPSQLTTLAAPAAPAANNTDPQPAKCNMSKAQRFKTWLKVLVRGSAAIVLLATLFSNLSKGPLSDSASPRSHLESATADSPRRFDQVCGDEFLQSTQHEKRQPARNEAPLPQESPATGPIHRSDDGASSTTKLTTPLWTPQTHHRRFVLTNRTSLRGRSSLNQPSLDPSKRRRTKARDHDELISPTKGRFSMPRRIASVPQIENENLASQAHLEVCCRDFVCRAHLLGKSPFEVQDRAVPLETPFGFA